jgi:hypothetical protein
MIAMAGNSILPAVACAVDDRHLKRKIAGRTIRMAAPAWAERVTFYQAALAPLGGSVRIET